MRVLIVSGLWPPDVGGPASHAPEVADFLAARRHAVDVVTTASSAPTPAAYPVEWVPRSLPVGLRHARAVQLIGKRARSADVVYATGMIGRAALAARLARRPYVLKLTADPAFERARRRELVGGDLDEFQDLRGNVRVGLLRRYRDLSLRGAAHVLCPSAYLRRLAIEWGVAPERVSVLPNPAPPVPELAARETLRRTLELNGPTLAFAGRLTTPKSLSTAVEATALLDGVRLLVAGEGPERALLEEQTRTLDVVDRVRFLGPLPRARVLELFRAADATVLPSIWENFPHAAVESLAVGTPVIATAVGGVPEIVEDGVNGLLVRPSDPVALSEAIARFVADETLQDRLRAGAAASVERFSAARIFGELETTLQAAAAR